MRNSDCHKWNKELELSTGDIGLGEDNMRARFKLLQVSSFHHLSKSY